MAELARGLGVSESCLVLCFERTRGMTPNQALLEFRLNRLFQTIRDHPPTRACGARFVTAVWAIPPRSSSCLKTASESRWPRFYSAASEPRRIGPSAAGIRCARNWCFPDVSANSVILAQAQAQAQDATEADRTAPGLASQHGPVSYTHLTLPTIYSV